MLKALLLSAILFFTITLFAQSTDSTVIGPHVHGSLNNQNAAGLTDGSKHPELVPDSTAFRLYFLSQAVDSISLPDARTRQHVHISGLRLEPLEAQSYSEILAWFRTEYGRLIKNYNEEAAAKLARGVAPDLAGFLQAREMIVHAGDAKQTQRVTLSWST